MTGYIRKDTTNNIADGNVINATDLDNEFDGVQAAFVVATGHTHDGTASEGAAITKIGPVQDVVVSIAAMYPKTTNTIDLGTSSLKYKDAFFAGNQTVGGTLAVTGVATLTAQPILSSLTASSAIATDASKGLVSVTNTGTGNNVLATSPTLVTPILGTPQSVTLTNATGLPISTGVSGLGTGVATALAVNVGSAGSPVINGGVLGTPSSGTVTNLTGTASININGTVGATTANTGAFTTLTTSSTVTLNGGTANGVTYLNGSKVLTTGSALTFNGTTFGVTGSITASGTLSGTGTNTWTLQSVGASGSLVAGGWLYGGNEGLNLSPNGAGLTKRLTISYFTGSAYSEALGISNVNTGPNTGILSLLNNVALVTSSGLEVTQSQLIGYSSYSGLGSYGLAVAGNVGIGTSSPAALLHLSSGNGTKAIWGTTRSFTVNRNWQVAVDEYAEGQFTITPSTTLGGTTFTTPAIRIDSAGNLGLGVTPSTSNSGKSFELGSVAGNILRGGGICDNNLEANARYNSGWFYVNTGLALRYAQNGGQHQWYTAPSGTAGAALTFTQAMTLDASGRLLVGATASFSAAAKLQVQDNISLDTNGTGGKLEIFKYGVSAGFFNTPATSGQLDLAATSILSFSTNSGERARIDASGNLGIGTTSPGAKLHVSGTGNAEGIIDSPGGTSILSLVGTAAAGGLIAYKGATLRIGSATGYGAAGFVDQIRLDSAGNLGIGTTLAGSYSMKLAVVNNIGLIPTTQDVVGSNISFKSQLGSGGGETFITNQITGFSNAANYNTAIAFSTRAGTTVAERMRLDSSGNFLVGTTTAAAAPTQGICFIPALAGTNAAGITIGHITGTNTGTYYENFCYNGASIGSITQSGTTAVLYNVTSDQRLKENIVNAPEFSSVIDSIKVRSYDWKTDQTHQRAGFIAQELVTVAPEAVYQPANPEEMMAVDYSKLVPMLVKEIQSLRARVAQLESK